MQRFFLSLTLAVSAIASGADAAPDALPSCPPTMQFEERKTALFDELQRTRDASTGLFLTQKLVSIWTTAPNWHAQTLLNAGIMRRQLADYGTAEAALDELIAYCPTFAEAYHQRALVYRAQGAHGAALADLDAALVHAPDHIGAMARKAQVLAALGRHADARAVRATVLQINPWMPDRLTRHQVPGTDI